MSCLGCGMNRYLHSHQHTTDLRRLHPTTYTSTILGLGTWHNPTDRTSVLSLHWGSLQSGAWPCSWAWPWLWPSPCPPPAASETLRCSARCDVRTYSVRQDTHTDTDTETKADTPSWIAAWQQQRHHEGRPHRQPLLPSCCPSVHLRVYELCYV